MADNIEFLTQTAHVKHASRGAYSVSNLDFRRPTPLRDLLLTANDDAIAVEPNSPGHESHPPLSARFTEQRLPIGMALLLWMTAASACWGVIAIAVLGSAALFV